MSSGRLLWVFFALVFWSVSTFSPYAGQQADTWGSLLSAQAWLEHGRPELTPYADKVDLYAYQFFHNARGAFYAYPPFVPLLQVPAVALARLFGAQMWDRGADALVQRQLVALTLLGLTGLLAWGYQALFEPRRAALWAFLSVGAGACLGALGAAFNSQLPAVLLVTWVQMLFLREYYGKGEWKGWPVGVLLALGYFCRPTGALWVPPALLYVLWRKPRQFPRALLALLLCLALYSLACWHFFGTPLHPYFRGRTLMLEAGDFSLRMIGILFSPGVGIFVYQPLLALSFFLGPARLRRNALFWALYAYVGLHLTVVALQLDWWGGASYGSRLTAETVLPLSIIGLMMRPGRALWLVLLPGLAWSLWLNVWIAYTRPVAHMIFGDQTFTIDPEKRVLWEWRLAPFNITPERLQQLKDAAPADLLSRLNQPNRQGFGDLERAGDHFYITPREARSEISFIAPGAAGRQSGSVLFRYASPRPAPVGLNGRPWTVLPASPGVIEKVVFFREVEWGTAGRLTFAATSGIRIFDLEVQNWNADQPGGLTYLEGWGTDEARPGQPSFRWSYGPTSQLRLSTVRGGKLRLSWLGHATKPGNHLEIRVNGRPQARLATLPLDPTPLQADLRVGVGTSLIEFGYSQWGSTSESDQRPLALAFQGLKLSWATLRAAKKPP
ncbi:MAG: glycosyltransferase family 39 protein [Candidatus Eremiobacteraeota bacterium]|nr:glycosyltransferase family 39 protein [Candidatus Eremiobacteraeota bacterium]MCW5871148.1 glycosyltransferase family 39 protein [Candidatus Eremiobacteraeota bacterium]